MGAKAVKYLKYNFTPDVVFNDLLKRNQRGVGPCYWPTGKQPLPLMDLYQAGTVCVDGSSMNTMNPKPIDEVVTPKSGISTLTLHG
jgi:hypothetical protein